MGVDAALAHETELAWIDDGNTPHPRYHEGNLQQKNQRY